MDKDKLVEAELDATGRCSCAEIEGEDPECDLHGLTIRQIAGWSDLDCRVQPEWESWTIRRVAMVTLRRLKRAAELIETARENGNFDDFSVAAEELLDKAMNSVCRDSAEFTAALRSHAPK